MAEFGEPQVNKLCESCQCSCKQSASAEVVMCPRYASIPQQRSLLDTKGKPTKSLLKASKAS